MALTVQSGKDVSKLNLLAKVNSLFSSEFLARLIDLLFNSICMRLSDFFTTVARNLRCLFIKLNTYYYDLKEILTS